MLAASEIRELVTKLALENDMQAYKKLFVHYYAPLVRFSFSIVRSKESAEELVSDVFLKIWNSRAALTTIDNFSLYIYIATKNLSLNRLQKDKKYSFFSLDDVALNVPGTTSDPERRMISGEVYRQTLLAINRLPPKCRLIFTLVKEDGLKYREVAELLDISPKTVEAQMTIALKKLGEAIRFHTSGITLN